MTAKAIGLQVEPLRYCAQCNRDRPESEFRGERKAWVKMCSGCRARRPGGIYQPVTARRHLRVVAPSPRVLWVERSGNDKLGPIGSATVSAETCPTSCKFYGGNGCYAEQGHVLHWWRRAQETGLEWEAFLGAVRAQPSGAVWRYATAGDLPGVGDRLDLELLGALVDANGGRRGHTFTHKPLTAPFEVEAVRAANAAGFTVNLSADDLEHADQRASLDAGPVAVVLPTDAPLRGLRTPAGLPVAVCPAQTRKGVTCATCQLCTRSRRTGVVGFLAHGQRYHEASVVARGRL